MMLGLRYLIFCFLPFLSTYLFEPALAASERTWENTKVETLLALAEETFMKNINDVYIIARQNVHNSDGTLKEIRTIELIIPMEMRPGHVRRNSGTDKVEKLAKNDDDVEEVLVKMQKSFKLVYDHEHCDTRVDVQKMDENGDVDLEIYVSKNEIYYQDEEGLGYYNMENITRTDKEKLAEEFKQHFRDKSDDTLISVLVWDEDGKFVSNKSKVEPMLLAYVDEASDDVEEEMLDTALKALSNSVLEHPNGVAKELSATMSNIYPEYMWLVTKRQEENAENAKYHVFIKATYDNVKLGDDIFEYTLYGIKK